MWGQARATKGNTQRFPGGFLGGRAIGGEGKQGTAIERMERVDGKLILQGAEDGVENVRDGLGWTVAISEEAGKAILTASGEQVAFVVFGACLPL